MGYINYQNNKSHKIMAKKAKKSANTNRMKLISARAKTLYKPGGKLKWTEAISKASTQLKKEGKL